MNHLYSKMSPHEITCILSAAFDGKKIESLYLPKIGGFPVWLPCNKPTWDFEHYRYRLKVKPIKAESPKLRNTPMMTSKQMIEVIQAHALGYEIECKINGFEGWSRVIKPSWNFSMYEYRQRQRETVHMWQWVIDQGNGPELTTHFYPDSTALPRVKVFQRADWTGIEVLL